MRIVLAHGWGADASFWDGVARLLDGHEIERLELGFFGGARNEPAIDSDTVCIGHSLGVLWLLVSARQGMRGLVSINGFDRFADQAAAVRAMRLRLKRDARRQLAEFHAQAGIASPPNRTPDDARLAEGLDWLTAWDGREAHARLNCPVMALASLDDAIAPPALTRSSWRDEETVWSQQGGHALPLMRPDWCAARIEEFARGLAAQ